MRGHPWRILGAQAALTALIIVVVYLVLLRPEGDGPLFGVDTPRIDRDRPALAVPPAARERRDQRPRRLTARVGERPAPGLDVPGPLPGPLGPPAEPAPVDTPSFDQYTGTLGQIRARLRATAD